MKVRNVVLIIGIGLVLIGSLLAAPEPPPTFYGDSPAVDSITWNWGDVLDEDGYCIHDNSEEVIGEVGADTFSYTETGLDENTEYERHCHSFTSAATGMIENITIGNGVIAARFPIDSVYGYFRCQMIYLQSEINKSGDITKIRFNYGIDEGGIEVKSCTIYMDEVDDATLSGWVGGDSGSGTEVFSGDLTMPSSPGWYEITLTTPFSYSNTKNLLVSFRHQQRFFLVDPFPFWMVTEASDRCVSGGHNIDNPPDVDLMPHIPDVQFEIDSSALDLSDPSNNDFAYTAVHNPDASDFTLENIGSNQVRITVTPPPNSTEDYTGVEIERATDSGFSDTTTIQSFTANYTFTDSPLADGIYWYRITFCNGDGVPTDESEGVSINLLEDPPAADFSANPTSGVAALTVQFTDESVGQIDTWSWDLDNDDAEDSTEQNPSHVYTAPGTYTVSLTVTGQGGSDTETKTDYITVTDSGSVNADFTASPTNGPASLSVDFTDLSTGADTWSWDFDGDSVEDSTEQNPSHVYTAPGTYTVSLTVTGTAGSDTETKTDYITVTDGSSVHADFSATPTNGPAPLAVTFTNLSTGKNDSWYWDFGDGNTSREENPVHTYEYGGTYTVYLIIDGPEGMDDEVKTDYIVVTGDPPPPPPPATKPKDSDKGGCSCSLDRKPVAPRNLVGYLMPLLLLVGVCLVLRRKKCSA